MGRNAQLNGLNPKVPPLDGTLHVPELYDWQYYNNPTQTAFLYTDGDSVIQHITYREFIPAIHRAGRLVASLINIDISGDHDDYPVVALISAADSISVFTILVSMLRLGVVCFPISPRFSTPVVAHLLQNSGAAHVLVEQHDTRLYHRAQDALAIIEQKDGSGNYQLHALPLYEDIYGDYGKFIPLPKKSYSRSSRAMIVHSSNSSSDFPKAVPWTVQFLLQTMTVPAKSSHNLIGATFSCHSIELFHPIGLYFLCWAPAYCLKLAVFRPSVPAVSPTSDAAFRGMRESGAQYAVTHTRFLEEWWQDPEKVSYLTTLRAVVYGGKLLKQCVGDFLTRQGVQLSVSYGSTESGTLSAMPSGDQGQQWEYFQLNPQCALEFIDQGDGAFLAVVMVTKSHCPPIINTQFMGQDACSTGDLLTPHPSKSGHWKVVGRLDDQVMLLTGEVINPAPCENILCESPYITAAVIFGRSRLCLGVLLELAETVDVSGPCAVEAARHLVWPSVERMNTSAPPKCHIKKEMIIFVQREKPLVYNPKGSPKRPVALLQYHHEIDMCYKGVCDPLLTTQLGSLDIWSNFKQG